MNKPKVNPNILLLIVVIIWASGFVAVEYALDANIGVSLMMSLRFFIASFILLIVLNKKIKEITFFEIRYGFLSGTFLFLAFYSQTLGQNHTNLSNVAFFTATNVIMVPFISWGINKKPPSIKIVILAFVALAGTAILTFKSGSFSFSIGDVLALVSALFFGSQIAFTEKAAAKIDATKLNFIQLTTVFLISSLVLLVEGVDFSSVNLSAGLLPIIHLGVFSTCVCYFLQTYAQKFTTANKAGIILSLEGFFGSAFSVLLGIEVLTYNLIIGGGLIITAATLAGVSRKGKNV